MSLEVWIICLLNISLITEKVNCKFKILSWFFKGNTLHYWVVNDMISWILKYSLHNDFDWALLIIQKNLLEKSYLIDAHRNLGIELIVFKSYILKELHSIVILLKRLLLNHNWLVKLNLFVEATWEFKLVLKFWKDILRAVD